MLDERLLSDAELQQRQSELENQIKDIEYILWDPYFKASYLYSLLTIEITEEDLYDEWCDPKSPHILTFEEISAAAYRIKYGVDKTPCTVRNSFALKFDFLISFSNICSLRICLK